MRRGHRGRQRADRRSCGARSSPTCCTAARGAALLGGVFSLSLAVLHGAVFVALKTSGPVRARARRTALISRPRWPLPAAVGGAVRHRRRPAARRAGWAAAPWLWACALAAMAALAAGVALIWRAPGGLGVRRHRRRRSRWPPPPCSAPSGAAPLPGPDPRRGRLRPLHAGRADLDRPGRAAVRAGLPGLDVLGVPQAPGRRGVLRHRPERPRLSPAPGDPPPQAGPRRRPPTRVAGLA